MILKTAESKFNYVVMVRFLRVYTFCSSTQVQALKL